MKDFEARLDDMMSRLTTDEKISLIPSMQEAVPRLGIPANSIGMEGAHGFVDRNGPSTTFPQTIGLASTWNRALLRKIGAVIGTEARAYHNRGNRGGLSLWFPTIDMERDIRWGRTEEGYGEDPFLTGELASEIIAGCQGDGDFVLAACAPKHFFANNNEKDRSSCSVSVPPRAMTEYYLEPFRRVFEKARPCSLMTAYNAVNGVPMLCHPAVREFVKNAWGMEGSGYVVTDGGAVSLAADGHHYFERHSQTVAAAFRAGCDCMTDSRQLVGQALRDALSENRISPADIDAHVRNILRVRFRLGEFDADCPYHGIGEESMMSGDARLLSRQAAVESIVLLKNEGGFLPLRKTPAACSGGRKRIAVIGPLADEVFQDWYSGNPAYRVSPLDAIRRETGGESVVFESGDDVVELALPGFEGERFVLSDWGWGAFTLKSLRTGKLLRTVSDGGPLLCDAESTVSWFVDSLFNLVPTENSGKFLMRTWNSMNVVTDGGSVRLSREEEPSRIRIRKIKDGIAAAEEAARAADTAVIFCGTNPMINGKEEVDRPDTGLPPRQTALLRKAVRANPRAVLWMISGYPYSIEEELDSVPAVVWSAHGLQEEGNAVADILFGAAAPSGHLTLTWSRRDAVSGSIFDYDIIGAKKTYLYSEARPLFPFGHGLSYTEFRYADLAVSGDADCGGEGGLAVSFRVRNAGGTDAGCVPQLYVRFPDSSVPRPRLALKAFDKFFLKAGEERAVRFVLRREEFAFFDVSRGKMCVESGRCEILVGESSADIRLRAAVRIDGETVPPRNLFAPTECQCFDSQRDCFLGERRGSPVPAVFARCAGAWILFRNCEFGAGADSLDLDFCAEGAAAVDLEAGGVFFKIALPNTGDNCAVPGAPCRPAWTRMRFPLERAVSGRCDLRVTFHGKIGVQTIRFNSAAD